MRRGLIALSLAVGCVLVVSAAASPARAQAPPAYYYPAAGNYMTTLGAVNISAPGYYYNVPMSAVPYQGVRSYDAGVGTYSGYAPIRRVSSGMRERNDLTWQFMR